MSEVNVAFVSTKFLFDHLRQLTKLWRGTKFLRRRKTFASTDIIFLPISFFFPSTCPFRCSVDYCMLLNILYWLQHYKKLWNMFCRSEAEMVQDRRGDPGATVPQTCPRRVSPQTHSSLRPHKRQRSGAGEHGWQRPPPPDSLTGLWTGPFAQIELPPEGNDARETILGLEKTVLHV